MKVLITGATGFLGFRTLERLIQEDSISEIVATGRTLKPTHALVDAKITYVLGELTDATFVDRIVQGMDAIIHAAALSSPWGALEAFEQANVETQKLLIAAALKNQITRFVYISTPSMYFEMKDKWQIKESDPLPKQFINHYAATKRQAEILLEKSGIPFVSLRPRALTGRGDTVIMPRLIRALKEGRLKIIGSGKNSADLTSVSNVADAIVLSLFAEGNAVNQIYNISNGEPVVLWEAIADVLKQLDLTPPTKKIPFGLVKVVAHTMEFKARITDKKEPALTVYGVGTLAKSFTMDITKARNLLGYEPKVSTAEAIQEFAIWYRSHES